MKKLLTKKEVLERFKREELPHIPKDDIPAKCEAWNNYVDMLEKEKEVNPNRSRLWANPF